MRSEFANTVLHYLGWVLLAIGLLILIPIIPALYYGETTILAFLISSAISLGWGAFLYKNFEKGNLTLGRAMVLAALAFAFMALIGACPYFMLSEQVYGEITVNSFVSAYFESMSGFTTTGLTTLPSIESVPLSLLFWRGFTQWIGGMGIIILFLNVLVGPGMSASYLYKGEAHEERIEPSARHTARGIVKVYLFYTLLGIIILSLLGMPVYDSIAHVFTSVSTGGFSTSTQSIAQYGNIWIEIVIMFLMVVGSVSFILHYKLLGWKLRELKGFLKSIEVRSFIIFMIIAGLIFSGYLYYTGDSSPVRHGFFQVFSAASTTGYTNVDISGWSEFLIVGVIALMFIGGSAGSTAGGLKIIRFMVLLKSIPWVIRKTLLPSTAVTPLKIGRKKSFTDDEVTHITHFFFIYVFMIIIGTVILTLLNYSFLNSLFETTSAAATVGLSTGITSYSMPILGKIVLIFEMWIGRLEILPVLAWILATIEGKRWSNFYE